MKARALVVLAALIFGACNTQQPPTPPASFDRPNRVAFVCIQLTGKPDFPDEPLPQAVDLSKCLPNPNLTTMSPYALHALVTQSSRGEVAAVDMQAGKVLDSRPDIPGYTFLPVGEMPIAIVVPAQGTHSRFTYVANSGSRDISVLNTRAFRLLEQDRRARAQTFPLPGGSRDAPYDMLLSPDEDALFVSLADTGRLLRVPIQRCDGTDDACEEGLLDADHISEIPLTRSLERAVVVDGNPDHDPYARLCDYALPVSNAAIAVPLPAADTPNTPHPAGMTFDNYCATDAPCRRRLLISDENLPLIHVVDLDLIASDSDGAVQAPILTGAPTRAVAVTPRVPTGLGSDAAETQYVYALDSRDGSVLVTENGRLLEVGTEGARNDRVTLGAGATEPVATTLSIVTPNFDVHGPAAQYAQLPTPSQLANPSMLPMASSGNYCVDTASSTRTNSRLRGVFLAVGVTDGSVRMVDVHDMDLGDCRQCKDPQCGCETLASNANAREQCQIGCNNMWDPFPVVRHRVRIATTPTDTTQQVPPSLTPRSTPQFISGHEVIVVRSNGATSDPEIQGLDCAVCGAGQTAAYGDIATDGTTPETGSDASIPDGGVGDAEIPDGGVGDAAVPPEGPEFTDACREGSARVCALADPWAELEDWGAEYRGVVPGTLGGQGTFTATNDDAVQEFRGETDFCRTGVLGADVLPGGAGDQITILGELAPPAVIEMTEPRLGAAGSDEREAFDSRVLATCQQLVAKRDALDNPVPIAFPIRAAYADHTLVSARLVDRPTNVDPAFMHDVALIRKCFGDTLLNYQVRAGRGYVVVGRNTVGFVHRVVAAPDTKHCDLDLNADPHRTGRALDGVTFDNGRITFQIHSGGQPPVGAFLSLALSPAVARTATSASQQVNESVIASLPVDLRWSPTDGALYMVDISSRGLLPILMSPFPTSGALRSFQ